MIVEELVSWTIRGMKVIKKWEELDKKYKEFIGKALK